MVATCGRPVTKTAGDAGNASAVAQGMAAAYLHYVEQVWAGDPDAASFARWLSSWWTATLPPLPARGPDAISPHGAGGRGIRWYGTPVGILGYASGAHGGGYRVPLIVGTRLGVRR